MAVRKSIRNRFYLIYTVIVIFFIMAVGRMFMIVTVEREHWLKAARQMERKNRALPPERGNIYSCNGELISATMPYYTLIMDTRVEALHNKNGKLYKENIDSLSICLSRKFKDKTPEQYKRMINNAYMNRTSRLKLYPHSVSYIDMMEVKNFPLFRLGRYKSGFIPEEKANRENLYGNLAGRTIGDIYGDGRGGQYGIELYYDSLLTGVPGEARGVRVGSSWVYVPVIAPEQGCDIITTIDVEMQDVCEKILKNKLEQIQAENGCLVLMEVATGEIKAMVNLGRSGDGAYRETWNMAVADLSEPGSTFKTVSLMIALENGVCDTADVYDINHGRWNFKDRVMTDHNWRQGGYDSLSVSEILAFSSNVGTSRIVAENFVSRDKQTQFVEAVLDKGFNQDLQIEIPGAARPRIPLPTSKLWSGTSLPWMSIGYGVQIPPIYTLNFYNAIANDGTLMRPYLVKRIEKDGSVIMKNSPEVLKSSICKPATLNKVKGMLEGVVDYGTAKQNASKEFKIAGKTGTAQLYYGKHGITRHQVSFCGYFPADKPLYSCIVVVKEPKMAPAAAFMSGVVFHDVAERVYAMSVKKHISSISSESGALPNVKGGKRNVVEKAMRLADVDYEKTAGDWVAVSVNDENKELQENTRPALDKIVPNVKGMGLSDAVYLMESAGLYVRAYGKGRVVSQSLTAGSQVSPGATVTLTLR